MTDTGSPTSIPETEHEPRSFAQITLKQWQDLRKYQKPRWLYRGHRCARWSLATTLERFAESNGISHDKLPELEGRLSREFRRVYQHYNQYLPVEDLEWFTIMQHHGSPTRLLDWTYSIYVAAYFALEDATSETAIWAVNRTWALEQSVSQMKKTVKKPDAEKVLELFDEGHKEVFKKLFLTKPFVRCATPLNPFRLNERLRVQKGVFLCQGDLTISFEENLKAFDDYDDPDNVRQIRIPLKLRKKGLKDLFNMNISRTTLFPDLDGFAKSLGVYHTLLDDFLSNAISGEGS